MPYFTLGVLIPPHVTDINAFVDGQVDRYDIGYPEANCEGSRLIRRTDAGVTGTGPWLAGVRNTGQDGRDTYDLDPAVIDHAIPTTQRALDCDIIPHALITATGRWRNHYFIWGPGDAHDDFPNWKRRVRRILQRHPGHRMMMLVTRN